MIKGGILPTRSSYLELLELLSTRRFMYANFCRESGYVQRYEGVGWLRSRRAVGDFSLRGGLLRGKSEARAWLEAGAKRGCEYRFTYAS